MVAMKTSMAIIMMVLIIGLFNHQAQATSCACYRPDGSGVTCNTTACSAGNTLSCNGGNGAFYYYGNGYSYYGACNCPYYNTTGVSNNGFSYDSTASVFYRYNYTGCGNFASASTDVGAPTPTDGDNTAATACCNSCCTAQFGGD